MCRGNAGLKEQGIRCHAYMLISMYDLTSMGRVHGTWLWALRLCLDGWQALKLAQLPSRSVQHRPEMPERDAHLRDSCWSCQDAPDS